LVHVVLVGRFWAHGVPLIRFFLFLGGGGGTGSARDRKGKGNRNKVLKGRNEILTHKKKKTVGKKIVNEL